MLVSVSVYANPDIEYFQKMQIIQRIKWQDEPDVLHYNIVIEKQSNSNYVQMFNANTNEPYYDIDLSPGVYRYKIVVYDLLGRERPNSQWATLTVLQALKPQINSWSPDIIYLDENNFEITLAGNNLIDASKVSLQSAEGKKIDIEKIKTDRSGEKMQISFNKEDVGEGVLNITIKNPGGLESNECTVIVANHNDELDRKSKILTISQGYSPLIKLKGTMSLYFDSPFYPAGISVRLGVLPFDTKAGSFGIEIEPSWAYFNAEHYDKFNLDWTVKAQFVAVNFFFMYQKSLFSNRFVINVRLGAGFSMMAGLQLMLNGRTIEEKLGGLVPDFAAGLSAKFFILETFFIEAGGEYVMMFNNDSNPMYIKPALMLGWTF
jgi:hypothetical protein